MAIDVFERGHTAQYTFTTSVAPDAAPWLFITGLTNTVIASISALTSASTAYYALFTMPTSTGIYKGEWVAQKTVNGSAYDFKRAFLFRVTETTRT